jgi:hypothetical protein
MQAAGCTTTIRTAGGAAALVAALLLAPVAVAAEFRGFVSDGPAGLLVFRACQGASIAREAYRVSDKSVDTALTAGVSAVRQVMEDRQRPLYVEFVGERGDGKVTVKRFQRAIGHVLACAGAPKDAPAGVRLLAAGTDDPWRFVAGASGAQLELARGQRVRFPAAPFAAPAAAGRTRVFDAWSPQDGGSIRVEVTEELCVDERTETAAGARVALRYGSTSFEGCAVRF